MSDIYEVCPIYESERFLLRKVTRDDAPDLLLCYSDPKSRPVFNSDNCSSDFAFDSLEKLESYIGYWLADYDNKAYIRFAIVDKSSGRAIGTIECFNRGDHGDLHNVGVLRLDLRSGYETVDCLTELFTLIDNEFYSAFGLDSIATKALPLAEARVSTLTSLGYCDVPDGTILPYPGYYLRYRLTSAQLAKRIAYCGLVCEFCHGADKCGGCKSDSNCCGRHTQDGGCYQYDCCTAKGIAGCWECAQGPCDKDMFSEHHDLRNRVFVKVARDEGVEKLAGYVLRNQLRGITYGWNRDYDNLDSEQAVIDLLHNGK